MFIACTTKDFLPDAASRIAAAQTAMQINPANRPRLLGLVGVLSSVTSALGLAADAFVKPTAEHLALVVSKYWGPKVRLTVSFPDTSDTSLINRIMSHMNAWGQFGDIKFSWTQSGGQLRIARSEMAYYSYLGTDNLHIPANQHTMMLGGFTMQTPESEYRRVVRHETGHALGFPHEHMLPELVARLDVAKTVAYFARTQGWSPQETQQQVLTPINMASVRATPHADQNSIMCYQLGGDLTKDGQPIVGGVDIDKLDAEFVGTLYPLPDAPVPPTPPAGQQIITVSIDPKAKTILVANPPDWTRTGKASQQGEAMEHIPELEAIIATPEGVEHAPSLLGVVQAVQSLIAAIQSGDKLAILKGVYAILGMIVDTASPAPDGASFGLFGGPLWLKLLPVLAKILTELSQ